MTTIDHRILIPAAPDVVWDYVSDITHNPDWQIDCQDVIFLTSRREGPGLRWRYATPSGHECVVAVTAWYNGLGYEYYYVDGVPYRENKGRIRLQEIPEGTVVQWTFTYELGGVLGGMRNALGTSRAVDHTIAESLKTLWQKVKQSGATARPFEARSLMRDAPNVDARSAYQPRHPSPEHPAGETQPVQPSPARRPAPVEPPISEEDGQRISIIAEPPVAKDDTRPGRPITPRPEVEIVPPDIEGEPDFLNQVVDFNLSRFEPPRDPSDTQPRKPIEPVEAAPSPAEAKLEEPPTVVLPKAASVAQPIEETEPLGIPLPESLPVTLTPTVSVPEPAVEPEQPTTPVAQVAEETQSTLDIAEPATVQEQATEPLPPSVVDDKTPIFKADPTEAPAAPAAEPKVEPPPTALSPAEKPTLVTPTASIWEIFGVQRPSETRSASAVSAPDEVAPPAHEPDAQAEPTPQSAQEFAASALPVKTIEFPRGSSRAGLRLVMRRKLVPLHRP